MRCVAALAFASATAAQYRGFDYGANNPDGSARSRQDFSDVFNRATNLQGQSGFNSARLYTMIQAGTANHPIAAIPAAIDTQTSLLLGLWASAGQEAFNNEVRALKNAINEYGAPFTDLIVGISVGSEDLYRLTPTGIENHSGAGSSPEVLVAYIEQVRNAIRSTSAFASRIGHVDTWTAWVNDSNSAVINACDWLGMDGYPYYQTTEPNGIENGKSLFFESYNATVAVSGGKEVWVTETGWPFQGPTANQAVASVHNAETYWQEVACGLLGTVNTWWFELYDPKSSSPDISFAVLGNDPRGRPLYDLECDGAASQPSSSNVTTSSSTVVTSGATPSTQTSPSTATGSPVAPSASTFVTVTSCKNIATPSACQPTPSSSADNTSPSTIARQDCPTNLDGQFEFPHLIIPVDSAAADKAYGPSYNGIISPTTSSIFNFDIPSSAAGKTCSLIFLLPEPDNLESRVFGFNGQGGIRVSELQRPVTEQSTFHKKPIASSLNQTIEHNAPMEQYLIFSTRCSAGERKGYEFSSTGGLDLAYFQSVNPSPIGAYITIC